MYKSGFTLIELSIVLVIIGLIVGGVLVGQDLIRASEIRATITQIEKYNTATNTFRGKFNALPGDMNYSTRATYGFNTGTTTTAAGGCGIVSASPPAGQGDGDGLIGCDMINNNICANPAETTPGIGGEEGCYWVDISSGVAGHLREGSFSTAFMSNLYFGPSNVATFQQYMPAAKIGRGNYIYVYQAGGINYFGMSTPSLVNSVYLISTGSLSPIQAYNIDKKVDDGYPNSGNVFAWFIPSTAVGPSTNHSPATAANQDCWDNGGTTPYVPFVGPQGTYATSINGGAGTGCGLSFKFQ